MYISSVLLSIFITKISFYLIKSLNSIIILNWQNKGRYCGCRMVLARVYQIFDLFHVDFAHGHLDFIQSGYRIGISDKKLANLVEVMGPLPWVRNRSIIFSFCTFIYFRPTPRHLSRPFIPIFKSCFT